VFGAGGGTSSYKEIEETDAIVLWGSNARAAHPIFFHHLLKGLSNGARMWTVDPRRTDSAKFADVWLGINVGSDIALANGVAHEIIDAGLENKEFIANATTGFEDFAAHVESWTLERTAEVTGVPVEAIRDLAHGYANAEKAQIMWTLGITEHHTAVDNVLALCNLSLLTGHIGRWGSGLVPLRGQNNVQGGGDMGALPNKLAGFQDLADEEIRVKFETAWDSEIPPEPGLHLTDMFNAMEKGELRALYVIGENPADSEADVNHAREALEGLDILVVQDVFMTRTAEMADVVLPAALGWAESDGTVTNSERRVQRTRAAIKPPGDARQEIEIISDLARHLGDNSWGQPTAEDLWEELRTVSPMHAGMSWERIENEGGIQWPCPDENHPGSPFLHDRLWKQPAEGRLAPFSCVDDRPPVESLDDNYPLRLTTGRALDSYNTGVQTGKYNSPIRTGEALEVSTADAEKLGISTGERVIVSSRRGSIEMTVEIDPNLPLGLAFTTFHFPELVDVNQLTNSAYDLKSGTAEFKAAAIRVEKMIDA
jgi:formate dehydrogenase major subunit